MKWLFFLCISFDAFSGFSEISEMNRYQYDQSQKKIKTTRKSLSSRKNSLDEHTKNILEKDIAILELLKRSEKRLIVRKKDEKITALSRMQGVLLNSVLAMNIKPSKFIVRINDDSDISGAELRCIGYSFEKRVPSKCDLLVIDDSEYKVDVDIWDLDGAEGMIADYYYSGEEKAFLTSSFASFLGSTFEVAKGGINSPFGTFNQNNARNKILEGLSSVSKNAQNKIIESGEKNLTISYINSGKQVLVFFNSSLNLSGDQK